MMIVQQKCLVVGADGTLGHALINYLTHQGWSVTGTTRRRDNEKLLYLDLSSEPSSWVLPNSVDLAVICAGISDVVQCQHQPEITAQINVAATMRLIEILWERGATVVYPSTNLVFNGELPKVKSMTTVSPSIEYGRQKAVIESLLLTGAGAVLRLGKVIDGPMNVIHGWQRALDRGEAIRAFVDYVFSPVSIQRTLWVIAMLMEQRLRGVFQMTAEDEMSYFELARTWAQSRGLSVDIESVQVSETNLGFLARQHATLDDYEVKKILDINSEKCSELLPVMIGIDYR
ncbi:NAD-dependent epimerase/dehydratase family protein [Ectothiorhodospiraceae bacterium BW-2]|nr:NAD-dependent epimerase/dehydratase family protein [Ectothiorhodospiraceae bacterium BW-2]